MKHDITRFAIYFNNEYIGEADKVDIIRSEGDNMPMIEIKGKYQRIL